MLDHLAIIIVGAQNSGKTTTLKHFCNTYDHKTIGAFKQGWRLHLAPFLPKYNGVKIIAYFLPASRSERNVPLSEIFKKFKWSPDFLFMAEQENGKEYNNTIQFLRGRNYHIKEFHLTNANPDSIWHHYDTQDKLNYLMHRTEQIADYVRGFINSRI